MTIRLLAYGAAFYRPREGVGTYVRPAASPNGRGVGEYLRGSLDYRLQHGDVMSYEPTRNGLPEDVPYTWRRPGWKRRARLSGLDLEEIAEADRETDGRYSRWQGMAS